MAGISFVGIGSVRCTSTANHLGNIVRYSIAIIVSAILCDVYEILSTVYDVRFNCDGGYAVRHITHSSEFHVHRTV